MIPFAHRERIGNEMPEIETSAWEFAVHSKKTRPSRVNAPKEGFKGVALSALVEDPNAWLHVLPYAL
ncbi:MAG: hypothetical protein CBD18_08545 [Opitutales bacterium TMED158]|nr:MAG: hypothetical protein CBD18_08545 [Opitutales bacterium TMED158]